MKVAYYVYPVAFQSPGGGEVQLLKTKEYVEKLGVEVKLFDTWTDKLKDFDLIHTFGSVKDALRMMESARSAGVPNVLSTICWHSLKAEWGVASNFKGIVTGAVRHAVKVFFPKFPSDRRKMFEAADLLLPNSEAEARQLKRLFGVPAEKISVVYNGVDPEFESAAPEAFTQKYGFENFVLCVGRIEPRKNQLNVVRALSGRKEQVVFIGDAVPHYKSYLEQCRREAGNNIHFIGSLEHGSGLLKSAYAACGCFLLATWLETPGLAALEAGLAGAPVVITREGATSEYFGDKVLYVNPSSASDIRDKVSMALQTKKNTGLREHIKSHYLWPRVAEQYVESYKRVLRNRHEA